MKRIALPLALLALAAGALGVQTIEQKAKIAQVVVYNDRCEITRVHKQSYAPGEYLVKFTDLPAGLFENSVRASGQGSAEAKISGVKVETQYLDTLTNRAYMALEDTLNQLREQVQSLNDRLGLINKETDFLERIKTASTSTTLGAGTSDSKDKAPMPSVNQWMSLFGFYDTKHEALNREIRSLERSKKSLEQRMDAVQKRLSRISSGGQTTKKTVSVNLTVERAGSLDLEISYMMMGAAWHPLYDIRVSPEGKEVEFSYYGVIYQTTGEDWKDAKVVLSTARPSVSGEMPTISAWYLDIARPVYRKGAAEQQARMNVAQTKMQMNLAQEPMLVADEITIEGGRAPEIPIETSIVEAMGTSYVFTTPGLNDIPSDGEPHKIPIAFEKLAAQFEYTAAPRLKPHAYLRAKVTNSTEYPFMAGDINVFFGNNFVGGSAIGTVIPSEKFDASLGVDEGIKVARKKMKDLTEDGKRVRRTYAFSVKVKNLKKDTETVTVYEQWPVSKNDQIKVKLVSPKYDDEKAEWGIKERPNGIIEWKMRLAPQKEQEMVLEYQVEYPRGASVSGL